MELVGRPHGVLDLPIQGIVQKPIDIECDRIMGLQLINKGKRLLSILGVYCHILMDQETRLHYTLKPRIYYSLQLMIVPMFLVLLQVTRMPHFHSTETMEETDIEGSNLMFIVCYSMTSCVQTKCVLVIQLTTTW